MGFCTRFVAAVVIAIAMAWGPGAQAVNVDAFIKRDQFGDIKLSPDGLHYAATVPMEDRTILVLLRRADNKIVGTFSTGKFTHVSDFQWVNAERVLLGVAEKFGALDQPQSLGEIYSLSTSGAADILIGQRVARQQVGTNIKGKKAESVFAYLVDDLPGDDRYVLVAVMPFAADPYTRLERMDVQSGRRMPVARAPVRNARFTTDNAGEARFARGAGANNISRLYVRKGNGDAWDLLNDEAASDQIEVPLGFSEDNTIAYLQVEHSKGPDSIVAMDMASGKRTELMRDDDTDPLHAIYRPGTSIPVGMMYMDGKRRAAFFDNASPEARQQRSLETAFADDFPVITSSTADGRLSLVRTGSDRNPGDFFVFDNHARKAEHLLSRRSWFDPEKMAHSRPVSLAARDGLPLKGYLTTPADGAGKNMPLVVVPHGGPFGIFDDWDFDSERQMLAAAGYAVLQVNFRGSGNHGRAFRKAGARQWGRAMQDDVTDATRWAIEQGHADPRRICIYGASYGAYAALMGVAREPDLYRCAVGYVGAYDLPTMHVHGDIHERGSGETYLREWIGSRDELAAVSPNRMADRIKVPVFLAAGGEDQRTPIEHSKMMERALIAAGKPVETLYYPNEGHGFYVEANRKAYYEKLLAFLGRHIGGKVASGATASK
jgi:dipeptidyl aminopeptidase/acylaminoacyl peptidase